MKKMIVVILISLSVAVICALGWLFVSNDPKIVGKTIQEDDFKEFYYTYSTTVNPPEFQRYRFYVENEKKMFYHEKREGDKVFLTEEDITVSGNRELTAEEWAKFWSYISGGTVDNRQDSTNSGGAGPWLYLYWNGDKDKCQEYTFADLQKKMEFEKFCMELKSR